MPDLELSGKVALVTGGAGGLGLATARALAAEGASVVIADVAEEAGRAAAEEVGGAFVATDVSDLASNEAMVAFAVDRFGGLDLVHLNAGVLAGTAPGPDFDEARYRRAMSVNVDGVVFGTQAALPALRARGGGAIVATSSLAGLTGVPLDPIYAASKHAVVGFVRSLAEPLAAGGIRINAVCPGFAESPMVAPVREHLEQAGYRIIPAERVADSVVSLFASEVTGQCWVIQPGRDAVPFEFRRIPGPR